MKTATWKQTFLPCFLCALALLTAKYGAGFTWRQVLIGILALAFCQAALKLRSARKFQRIQFRVFLKDFRQALIDAGIYSEEELKQNENIILDSLGQPKHDCVIFTWLKNDLFFVNNSNLFCKSPEFTINLKSFGERAAKNLVIQDYLELRGNNGAYELILIKAEDRYYSQRPDGIVLIKIPYELFGLLQSELNDVEFIMRPREILGRVGLKYDNEMSDFQGKYASLDWFEL